MKKIFFSLLMLFSASSFAAKNVEFETSAGNFTVELNEQLAPISVANFIKYVNDGSYVGTQFHRVIPGFMAQGGGFDKNMVERSSYAPIQNEAANGLENLTATIAMARTSNPNSATRQFFINLKDNDFLNYSRNSAGYAVFGKVTKGFSVIQAMAQKPTHSLGMMQDVPVTPIMITKATIK
ncbi:peptidylprolyl isomerase [Vibrio rumoiensis]|uniref:Peptidyl-prolyl cis-trans isomerase n=1 Tax=Vibrio rumoiensis 1S-45 TaxID=1188252 RepID=A0A1E5E3E3_9VIBR|nr:peptidylprolyl isomerase [Vibrio rumoiensis]OEF26302.1 peptidyl-prolyl cis-trans isomerase [Vibrio rumoiensis 1S-45]